MAKKDTRHISNQKKLEINTRRAEMQTEIRRLAAIANKRLRALERHGLTETSNAYRYIERRHFDKDSAIAETRSGKIKFDESLKKKSAQQLQHELVELKRFLYEAKTSTVAGAKEHYEKAYQSYKEAHKGMTLSREEFDAILSADGFKRFLGRFTSDQIMQLVELRQEGIPLEQIEQAMATMKEDESLAEFIQNAKNPFTKNVNEPEEQPDQDPTKPFNF